MDDDWKKTVRMASNTEQEHPNLRYKVLAVGPATGDVYSRMPYMDNVYFPEDCALEHFNVFLEKTKAAITQEPLFRESFTDLGVWEDG